MWTHQSPPGDAPHGVVGNVLRALGAFVVVIIGVMIVGAIMSRKVPVTTTCIVISIADDHSVRRYLCD